MIIYVCIDLSGLLVAKHQFKSLFETHLPQLYAHFIANDVYSDMHTVP
jgi:tryptophan-rich sensory protein